MSSNCSLNCENLLGPLFGPLFHFMFDRMDDIYNLSVFNVKCVQDLFCWAFYKGKFPVFFGFHFEIQNLGLKF